MGAQSELVPAGTGVARLCGDLRVDRVSGDMMRTSPGRPTKRPFWPVMQPIAEMLKAGTISRRQAAISLGVHISTTRAWLPVANAKGGRPSRKPSSEVLAACMQQLKAGTLSRRQMAIRFACTVKTTYVWLPSA